MRIRTRTLLAAVLAAVPVAVLTGLTVQSDAAAGNVYYVAPNGSDSAAGTQSAPWASVARAQSTAVAGDLVYLRGGTYSFTRANKACASQTDRVDAITLNKSGSQGNPIRYWAYPAEKPIFDFSRMTDNCRIKGFDVTGSWNHLKGIEVTGVRQNNNLNHESWGIWVSGSNNTFELLNAHHNMGPGLFIQDGGGNLVLNCDSHDNYDSMTSNGAGESADGFGAHIPANRPGNVFRGNRAWNNSDDGFDLISAYSPVVIENSWAWHNGYIPGTNTGAGNGNGIKAGGYGGDYVSNGAKHTVRFSVAFNNRASGIYANHHTVANDYFNNTSYNNHPDYNMLGVNSSGAAIGIGNLRNNIAYGGTLSSNMSGTNAAGNSWNLPVTMSDSQFQSVSTSGWDAPRRADGSLPTLANLHLAPGSTLIDKGADVGLPYSGGAPDLGAFETSTTSPSAPPTAGPSATPSPTRSPSPSPSVSPSASPKPSGSRCTAAYQLDGSWSGGFQATITVTNSGASATTGWTVRLTLPTGQTVSQLWNADYTQSGGQLTATNASWNGALTPGATAAFGFVANGDGATPPTSISCTAS
ncbi:cellulose binding domain-containing protein [Catellatospora sp. KI3]|uniref:right-handed parallel beta-helix repeat-containing protein n=1 Tax=Catellatospora sp. KI3 TaxID=3041620 RepID=UPI002482403C|nr:cellulose binding domain-containing protein [Catellatospora sp. KI3]MDI1460823.1 cellulose binding domain-containing protein [Catellatospora sp. KI3]